MPKILILGDKKVGKTSIIENISDDYESGNYIISFESSGNHKNFSLRLLEDKME